MRASGVESEMELAYAGLHQFCGSMLAALQRLPGPQREALEVAFGLRGGEAPDRLMVGLAVLGLVSEAADNEPLVCLVDDAQWLDQVSAQTLAFVGRRLLAERVALVFAVRDGDDGGILAGLPELIVRGLPEADARALLDAAIPGLAGRAGQGADRGGDGWQPACVARVAAWVDPGRGWRRFRAAGRGAVG